MPSIRAIVRELDPTVPVRNVQTLDDVVVGGDRADAMVDHPARHVRRARARDGRARRVRRAVVPRHAADARARNSHRARRVVGLGARLVVRRGLGLVDAGLVIGIAGALALTRFMTTLLFGVTPTDPLTFVVVAALLTGAPRCSRAICRRVARLVSIRSSRSGPSNTQTEVRSLAFARVTALRDDRRYIDSSMLFGQSCLSSRDSARSASSRPSVWQRAQ